MPQNAASSKKGVRMGLGRGGGASRQITSPGLKGEGTTTTGIGKAQGGAGRDERCAGNFAEAGNQIIGSPGAKNHNYD